MFGIDKNVQGSETECANALTAREDRGVSNFKQTGTAIAVGFVNPEIDGSCRTLKAQMAKNSLANFIRTDSLGATAVSVAIPVLTPDRAEKSQNGRRFKDNGEDMFTLTSQDRHGVGVSIPIREAVSKGYTEATEGDSINLTMPDSKTRRGRAGKKQAQTLDCGCNQGIIVKLNDNDTVYAVWYEKAQCYIAVRRLTPKEYFRLQGWTDEFFEKAKFVNSDTQLYKQAGNGVTVNVIKAIAEKF
jgi:DNA (cytosine-5)-methyltransferase 1